MHSELSRRRVAAIRLEHPDGARHERFDEGLNAWASDYRMSESNHRQFYRRWAELMAAGEVGRGQTWVTTSREVEQFLYREARMLDERRFHEWLELFTDDVRYWMAGRSTRYPRSSKAITVLDPSGAGVGAGHRGRDGDPRRDQGDARRSHRAPGYGHGLGGGSSVAHASHHLQHRGGAGDTASELKVYSNFLVYRTRAETEQDFYVGARKDLLRRVDGAWKIARRKLVLDQNVLLPKNVSVFF